jgi:hypothetical protein
VEKGVRDGCHREAALEGALDLSGKVDPYAGDRPAVGDCADVNQARPARKELPPPGRGDVAESGARPGVEEGGRELTLCRKGPVADRVDAGMDAVQAPRS